MADLLTALALVFISAGALLLVTSRWDLPTVPLLIVAGLMIGPFVAEGELLTLAQWGIAFLVFGFGVREDLTRVKVTFTDAGWVALAQILVLGTVVIGLALWWGLSLWDATYLGIAAALSSTIVGSENLRQAIVGRKVHGWLADSVHFLEDLLAVVLVLVLTALAVGLPVADALAWGVVFFAVAFVINRFLFGALEWLAGSSQELMTMGAVTVLVGFLAASELVGISIVVGAFAAGLAIRADAERYLSMLNGLDSIQSFFSAIFFVTLGALVSWVGVEALAWVGVLVVATAVVKPGLTMVVLTLRGYDARTASRVAAGLDQVSEFALVIAIHGFLAGVLAPGLFDAIVLAAAATMVTSALTVEYGAGVYERWLRRLLGERAPSRVVRESRVEEGLGGHVIVAGFGEVGRPLVGRLLEEGERVVVVESDPRLREEHVEAAVENYVAGDASLPMVWELARAEHASLIVSTVPEPPVAEALLGLETEAVRLLEAVDREAALALLDRGVEGAFVRDSTASFQLVDDVRAVLEDPERLEEVQDANRRLLSLGGSGLW